MTKILFCTLIILEDTHALYASWKLPWTFLVVDIWRAKYQYNQLFNCVVRFSEDGKLKCRVQFV
jgi:hypothetical protein